MFFLIRIQYDISLQLGLTALFSVTSARQMSPQGPLSSTSLLRMTNLLILPMQISPHQHNFYEKIKNKKKSQGPLHQGFITCYSAYYFLDLLTDHFVYRLSENGENACYKICYNVCNSLTAKKESIKSSPFKGLNLQVFGVFNEK